MRRKILFDTGFFHSGLNNEAVEEVYTGKNVGYTLLNLAEFLYTEANVRLSIVLVLIRVSELKVEVETANYLVVT